MRKGAVDGCILISALSAAKGVSETQSYASGVGPKTKYFPDGQRCPENQIKPGEIMLGCFWRRKHLWLFCSRLSYSSFSGIFIR